MLHVQQLAVLQAAVSFFMDANLPVNAEGCDDILQVRILHVVAAHACQVCLLAFITCLYGLTQAIWSSQVLLDQTMGAVLHSELPGLSA